MHLALILISCVIVGCLHPLSVRALILWVVMALLMRSKSLIVFVKRNLTRVSSLLPWSFARSIIKKVGIKIILFRTHFFLMVLRPLWYRRHRKKRNIFR